MITGIAIENFKGIGDRIEIPFKPLTFLFGPNSSGKSTILHALHYLREIFDRRNLDADTTACGGRFIDLGGFAGMVHQHDLNRRIRLAVTLDLTETELPTYASPLPEYSFDDQPEDLFTPPTTAKVEVEITWQLPRQRPVVTAYNVDFDGAPIVSVTLDATNRPAVKLCLTHPSLLITRNVKELRACSLDLIWKCIKKGGLGNVVEEVPKPPAQETEESAEARRKLGQLLQEVYAQDPNAVTKLVTEQWLIPTVDSARTLMLDRTALSFTLWAVSAWGLAKGVSVENDYAIVSLPAQNEALPSFNEPIPAELDWSTVDPSEDTAPPESAEDRDFDSFLDDEDVEDDYQRDIDVYRLQHFLIETLSRIIVGPGQLVRECLQQSRYLGPLRETPPRNYTAPKVADDARWASGLGAWDVLETGQDEFVNSVSNWLSSSDRLDAGCELRVKRYKELDLARLPAREPEGDTGQRDRDLDGIIEASPTRRRLVIVPRGESVELRPHDVGVGISQIVPVVVTALHGEGTLCAIEQPELHLHPRLQAALGDLFIEGHLQKQHSFLIETHSELLRLTLFETVSLGLL